MYKEKYYKYKTKYTKLKLEGSYNINLPITKFTRKLGRNNKFSEYFNIEGIGDPRVSFFNKILSGISKNEIIMFIKTIIGLFNKENDLNIPTDLILLLFQSISPSEINNQTFYYIYLELYEYFSKSIINLLPMIHFYGNYNDYIFLLKTLFEEYYIENDSVNNKKYDSLINKILKIIANQFKFDLIEYNKSIEEKRNPNITSLAKNISEITKFKIFDKLLKLIYSNNNQEYKLQFEIDLANLNESLDNNEVYLMAQKYSELEFEKKYIELSHLNENKLNLNSQIHSEQLQLHEIIRIILNIGISNLTTKQKSFLIDEWNNYLSNKKINSKNLIPIIDVSGSMYGIPIYVGLACAILLSELNPKKIRDKLITFSENPSWMNLNKLNNIISKIEKIKKSSWDQNINFELVYNLIINLILEKKLSEKDVPNIIIFTDKTMINTWNGKHNLIIDKFKEIGLKLSKKYYDVPNLIYWNLRSNDISYSKSGNIISISGFSQQLLDNFLFNENQNFKEWTIPNLPDSFEMMRNRLDDDRYSLIKKYINVSSFNK